MNTTSLAFSRAVAARRPFALPAALHSLHSLLERAAAAAAPSRPALQELGRAANLWVARPLGRTITCESGALWLTFDNEPQDVVLEAGQSHRCIKASKLLIHAMTDARFQVA